jgi:hypothetical protein
MPGTWTTYLIAQTVNDTAEGMDPIDSAPTIGGLGVTDNLAVGDPTRSIAYGHSCPIDAIPNGEFTIEP